MLRKTILIGTANATKTTGEGDKAFAPVMPKAISSQATPIRATRRLQMFGGIRRSNIRVSEAR